VLADRFDQRKQIAISQSLAFLLMMTLYGFYEFGWLNIWWLMVFRIVLTALVSLSQPARLVLVPSLAGPENMAIAVSFGALIFNLARFIGPALAGLLLVGGDFGLAFLVNGLSYLGLVAAVLSVQMPTPNAPSRRRRGTVLSEIGSSVSYIAAHKGLAAMFGLFGVVVIAGRPIAEMIPAFVGAVFDGGVDGLAILTSAMAIGSIIGGLFSTKNRIQGLTRTVLRATLAYSLCIVLFVWMPVFWMAVAVLTLSSVFTVTVGVSAQTLVQTAVDPDIRGRVMSLWFVLSRGGPALGAFIIGTVSQFSNLQAAFSVGGALCFVAAAFVWRDRTAIAANLEVPKK